MDEYLLFQLYGPLQAYGGVAVGEERPTGKHPSRSAVIGLLAASLGVRREEEERLQALDNGYAVAVRADSGGATLLDYHTVQTPKEKKNRVFFTRRDELGAKLDPFEELNTILSRREYLCDAAFTVCLRAREDAPHTPAQLAAALRRPRFSPYLGRKSCPPGLPFAPQVARRPSLAEAFAGYPLDARVFGVLKRRGGEVLAFADEDFDLAGPSHMRRDLPAHHGRRQFRERPEVMLRVPCGAIMKEDEHVHEQTAD